jgi:threonine synthase
VKTGTAGSGALLPNVPSMGVAMSGSLGARPVLLERFRDLLPVTSATPLLTLGEGATPLVRVPRLGAVIGASDLWLKVEGANPTGSFKDRGMVVAVAKAAESGARAIVCASTGNTSASAAAYAAAAGLEAIVLLPAGKIAAGKLLQAFAAGAKVISIDGNFDDALEIVRELGAGGGGVEIVNSINPHRIAGQATAAHEIIADLGDAPDVLALPVGNAGNISAYWRGFTDAVRIGSTKRRPRMAGFQAAGAAPFVSGAPVLNPETVATAIRIGKPASWDLAIAARDESGGFIRAVTDDEILRAQADIIRLGGIFVEPACAAPIAGLRNAIADGSIDGSQRIVAVMTGFGLKDPDTASRLVGEIRQSDATVAGVRRALGW